MLGVVPNGLFSDKTNQSRYASTFGAVGYILPVALSSTAPWLTGRRVDPHQVNYPLVQEWLHFCKKNHGCRMRYSRPDNLQMIDCKTMQTVTAPPNCNYFALSYVWGKAKTAPPLSEPYSSPELLRNAAPVVRDAIQVVKSLGGRYIWVDKYCIPQNDPHLKGEQLSRMDLIYEGAYCTIVAAAGENDQHGLPGISRRRDLQPSIKVRDNYFVSTLLDPQQEIRKSVWMTRAWTYQEALCSARRLIFTEHQVYFECKVM
ncbi:HET-domain-containing protein, partial [Lojkania enalia]